MLQKGSSNKEIDKLTVELINENILKHTIQLFVNKNNEFKPFGSGVLALIHDTHFILTCSHVADFFENNPSDDLFIRVNKNGFINIIGDIKYTDIEKSKNVDLAYIKLDKKIPEILKKAYTFITIDKIRKHFKILDGVNYCVLGYPEKNIKKNEGTIETGASFFLSSGANEKPYKYYKFDMQNFIIININGKATDLLGEEGKTKIGTDFYGISGGGLWLIIYIQDLITQKYTLDYKLVGIMTDFRKGKYFCFIANKIHIIIDAFEKIEGYKFKEIRIEN